MRPFGSRRLDRESWQPISLSDNRETAIIVTAQNKLRNVGVAGRDSQQHRWIDATGISDHDQVGDGHIVDIGRWHIVKKDTVGGARVIGQIHCQRSVVGFGSHGASAADRQEE